jgi:hypothetical protein
VSTAVKKSAGGIWLLLFLVGTVIAFGGLFLFWKIGRRSPEITIYPIKPVDLNSAPVTLYPQLEGRPLVTWETLSHFRYDSADIDEDINPKLRLKKKKYPLPNFVKALDQSAIAVCGFMIPIDTDDSGNRVMSFILARSQATCCYGITPKMNEWMYVQMAQGKSADSLMDVPITVFGTISVGEEKKQDMEWSLYRMVADKVVIPKQSFW